MPAEKESGEREPETNDWYGVRGTRCFCQTPHSLSPTFSLSLGANRDSLIQPNLDSSVLRKFYVLASGREDVAATGDCSDCESFKWTAKNQACDGPDARAYSHPFCGGGGLGAGLDFTFRVHGTITATLIDGQQDRKSTRLNSSHMSNSYAVFCL